MREAQSRPRYTGPTVNVANAEIPYDWQVWTPPSRAGTLPGLPIPQSGRVEGYNREGIAQLLTPTT